VTASRTLAGGAVPRIVVEGLWKKYRKGASHDSIKDLVSALARSTWRRGAGDALDQREFWALRDVSFAVEPGEVMGVIGPNGSGKSTLLKLLTRIVRPTHGTVDVRGRVGALIELAAGFHGELSGRENVYLQGAIMGMKRSEVGRRFDEIVDFAGVGDFIDTPVKRYSSGMHARLGFSIAAHMDPDVLLIDEVLSVGDFAFQQKAEARLKEIVRREIPVIVVSHRLESITRLCDHALLLSRGQVALAGTAEEVVAHYVDGRHLGEAEEGEGPLSFGTVGIAPAGPVMPGVAVTLTVHGEVREAVPPGTVLGFRVWRVPDERILFATEHEACGATLPQRGPFTAELEVRMNVGAGVYRLQPAVWIREPFREWTRGPSALVEVEDDARIMGSVHFDPRLRIDATQAR
jgi:ABC-type polysaccharide/polyol phosphate transport system ATPase subunit